MKQKIIQYLKQNPKQKQLALKLYYYYVVMVNLPRVLFNWLRLPMFVAQKKALHIGCGYKRLANYLNVDVRPTFATDLAFDCRKLRPFSKESFRIIFSHAFFEHLFYDDRLPLLQDCHRTLQADGMLLFAGIPDFEEISRAYLEKRPGLIGPRFDLDEVYRFTHGAPETAPGWWLEQLHKTLFDKDLLKDMAIQAGFSKVQVFRYCFKDEAIPLNLGFAAGKSALDTHQIVHELEAVNMGVNTKTIEWL